MPPPIHTRFEPRYFQQFHCLGSECEDTCCEGWGIVIDRDTYDKYRNDPGLSALVAIHPAATGSRDFARIRLDGIRCPALADGICSVQQTFGESCISDMCSSFPRVLNVVDGVLERSLHLSCPEAARLVLRDPEAMTLDHRDAGDDAHRAGSLSVVSTAACNGREQFRKRAIEILKDRSRPLWKRLTMLGSAIEELSGRACVQTRNGGDGMLRLEIVLELIVSRISAEYASPRFLACYSGFMRGIGWNADSTMDEIAGRHGHALATWWAPFADRNPHVLENYLVNYAFRTLFPFGRKQPDQTITIDTDAAEIRNAYTVLVVHFAMIRTLLIGLAGWYGESFGMDHVIELVQSYTKAFQHSGSFPAVILQAMADKGITNAGDLTFLIQD